MDKRGIWRMDKRDIGWISVAVGCAVVMAIKLAGGQTLPVPAPQAQQTAPAQPQQPAAYSFTFTPEGVDALYGALERANQVQLMVTGDRSARWDSLQAAIRDEVAKQKEAVAKQVKKDEAPAKPDVKP